MPEKMKIVVAIVSAIFMVLALSVTFLNYMIGYRIIQNRKKGITKPVSFIPTLSIIFSFIAYKVGRSVLGYWPLLPTLLDPSTWNLIGLPFYLLTRYKKEKS